MVLLRQDSSWNPVTAAPMVLWRKRKGWAGELAGWENRKLRAWASYLLFATLPAIFSRYSSSSWSSLSSWWTRWWLCIVRNGEEFVQRRDSSLVVAQLHLLLCPDVKCNRNSQNADYAAENSKADPCGYHASADGEVDLVHNHSGVVVCMIARDSRP